MPVLGVVLSFESDAALLDLGDPRITFGAPTENRVPVVLETGSRREERELIEQIENLPGVVRLDVAFHDFSDIHGVCE